MLRRFLYLYQKSFLTATLERKLTSSQIPAILKYFKTFYISNNDLFLNNPAICPLEDLKDKNKLEEMFNNVQFIHLMDNETMLIIQALKINTAIITLLSFHFLV